LVATRGGSDQLDAQIDHLLDQSDGSVYSIRRDYILKTLDEWDSDLPFVRNERADQTHPIIGTAKAMEIWIINGGKA